MHVIRLRSAWRPTAEGVYSRRFNKPTGLEGGDQVWLAVDGAEQIIAAEMNGQPLEFPAGRIEVTKWLQTANVLIIHATQPSLLASVRLEIVNV
jgi:hypothetical protein